MVYPVQLLIFTHSEVESENETIKIDNWYVVGSVFFIILSPCTTSKLLQACCLVVIKPISRWVCIACSGLIITRVLQVVNKLDAGCCQDLHA